MSDEKEKLDLSFAQLATGALSTVTVTIVSARFFGSAGTLTAGALTSMLSTSASAIYKHGVNRTTQKLKTVRTRQWREVKGTDATPVDGGYTVTAEHTKRLPNWKMYGAIAGTAAAIFGGTAALMTGAEAAAGKPVSAIVQGKKGSGTSLFGGHISPAPTPTYSPTTPPPSPTTSTESTPAPTISQSTTQPEPSPSYPQAPPTTGPPAQTEQPPPNPPTQPQEVVPSG